VSPTPIITDDEGSVSGDATGGLCPAGGFCDAG